MLMEKNSHLFVYVIARDFGFAPNPFFGICTLATCKPGIRKGANVGDWVMGVAGRELGKSIHKKCILLMKVTEKIGFQEYWNDTRFQIKKPCRNGSALKMIGDNIYHRNNEGEWIQEDSHHSLENGMENEGNLNRDTGQSDQVLISNLFFYFGNQAIPVNLELINYKPGLGFKKISLDEGLGARGIIETVCSENERLCNTIVSDPCQFADAHKRVDQRARKITG